jgi:3,4-dihydroxy 2-butanone 4-phosphate synthase/GTP cyclohydrolase II
MQILATTTLPTEHGSFRFLAFGAAEEAGSQGHPHVALHSSQPGGITDVRIHSECMTGDVFSSVKCDCGPQLNAALDRFGAHGGLLIYLRQEGRGIGLVEKVKAYELQAAGRDTLDANLELGHGADDRAYDAAIWLLKELGIPRVRLHSNNPEKVQALLDAGIEVVDRVPLEVGMVPENAAYLKTKRDRMGHLLQSLR